MVSTTFGYDKQEDRLWMSFDDGTPRLWLTRRLVAHLMGPVLGALESSAPGAEGGADASTRVALEHELALGELQPGEERLPLKMGSEAARATADADYLLCLRIATRFDATHGVITFESADGQRQMAMGRVGLHRWLRGLYLVLAQADWNLPPVPEWLRRSLLPDGLRALVDPPPPDAPAQR